MSTSTNGILVFGIDFDESLPEFMGNETDFEDFLQVELKLPMYGSAGYSYEEKSKKIETCPANLVIHCSYDYPMYILALRGTEKTAHRGYPVEITSLEIAPERLEAFKDWCKAHGIENPEPKWLLASLWS
jgi:hypothetical protein